MPQADAEVADILAGHFACVSRDREVNRWYRAAYQTKFWSDNPWKKLGMDGNDDFPVKVEVNQVWPFVSAHVANLFFRRPRFQVLPPAVYEPRRGRPRQLKGANDIVAAYLDDWVWRSGTRARSTLAYQIALMYGSAAFKTGIRQGSGDSVSRSWSQVLPPWEALWDRDAQTAEQQAFRGHVRWERLSRIREITGDKLEGVEGLPLPDYLIDGGRPRSQSPTGKQRAYSNYAQVLEFYDLEEDEQRFYLVEGYDQDVSVRQLGETMPCPFRRPDGTPGDPIVPVILSNTPEKPWEGVSAVGRIYPLAAEQNLLLTVVANQMRRDANRIVLYLKQAGLDDDTIEAIRTGGDLTFVGVNTATLDGAFRVLEMPDMSGSLAQYKAWLEIARQDTQGSSDLMQGRQGKYLSATEAGLLSAYGEATSSDLQQRMMDAITAAGQVQLWLNAEETSQGLNVLVGAEYQRLTPELMSVPWELTITDAAATPARDQARKADLLAVQELLLMLVTTGAGGPDPATPLRPEVSRLAQEMLDYVVQLWRLPESMSWTALSAAGIQTPGEERAKVKELLKRLRPMTAEAPAEVLGGTPDAIV